MSRRMGSPQKTIRAKEPPAPEKYLEFTVYFVNPEHDGFVLLKDIAAALQSKLGRRSYHLTQQRRRHYWKVQFACNDLAITEKDIREQLSTIDATWIDSNGIERSIREVPLLPPTLHLITDSPSPEFLAAWQKEVKRFARLETKKRNRLNKKRRDKALYPPPQ